MRKLLFITLLFLGNTIEAQNDNFQKTNNKKLEKAFEIQSLNCSLIEQLLKAITSDSKKNSATKETSKNTFYAELRDLYNNFKSADKNFDIPGITPEEWKSIQDFYNVKLSKIDSLYKLRNTSIPITIITENPTDVITTGQLLNKTNPLDTPPTHESCKTTNPPIADVDCVHHILRRSFSFSYNIPEFRFSEEGIKTKVLMEFLINKNGEVVLTKIIKSSNYFEFDMEAILTMDKLSAKYKFTPAISSGRIVSTLYTFPVTISAPN